MKKSQLRQMIKKEIQRLNEFKERGSSILPVGLTDLKTGENEYLNIYEDWAGSYVNIFKTNKNKYVGVCSGHSGSGKTTMKQHNGAFIHDQTGRFLGQWQFVEEIPIRDKDKLIKKYKKFKMYTYK